MDKLLDRTNEAVLADLLFDYGVEQGNLYHATTLAQDLIADLASQRIYLDYIPCTWTDDDGCVEPEATR